jgi:hypothetical protein
MWRKALCLGLMAVVLTQVPVAADDGGRSSTPQAKTSSTTKRVVWTLVGIGAGFGLGIWAGLTAFDDSINSDRKAWTTVAIAAAAGGVAGALLSKNVGRSAPGGVTAANRSPLDRRLVQVPSMLSGHAVDDDLLRRRVRAVNPGGAVRE